MSRPENVSLERSPKRTGLAGLRVEWLDHLEQIEALRDAWIELEGAVANRTVFSTFDWVVPWYRHYYGTRGTPLVGVARRRGRLAGIAPLVYSRATLGKIPVRRVDFAGYTSSAGEFLVPEERPATIRAFLESLAHRGGFDVLCLNGIEPSSEELAVIRDAGRSCGLLFDLDWYRYAVVDLARGYDGYCRAMSQNFRRNLKRLGQRMAAAGTARTDSLHGSPRDDAEVEAFVQRMFAVADRSRKARTRGPTADHFKRFYTEVTLRFARRGMADLSILAVNDRDAAFILGLVERNVYYDVTVGYDVEFEHLSPGTYLMQEVLRRAADRGIQRLVSHGDHEYKERWASGFVPQARTFLFARGLRGTLSRFARFRAPVLLALAGERVPGVRRLWQQALRLRARP